MAISQFRFIVPLLFCHGALGLEVFWNPLTFEEIRDGGVFSRCSCIPVVYLILDHFIWIHYDLL